MTAAIDFKERNFTRASLAKFIEVADAKLDDYLQRLNQSDAAEIRTGGSRVKNLAEKIAAIRKRRTRCKDMLAELDRTGKYQVSLTDPDSTNCFRGSGRTSRSSPKPQPKKLVRGLRRLPITHKSLIRIACSCDFC